MYKPKQTKMIEVGKYYKATDGCGLLVKALSPENEGVFYAEVIVKAKGHEYSEWCDFSYFTPYTPTPQELIEWGKTTTLTNDNPNKVEVSDKDVNLRLECLKLIVELNKRERLGAETCIIEAAQLYDYVTGKTSMNYELL